MRIFKAITKQKDILSSFLHSKILESIYYRLNLQGIKIMRISVKNKKVGIGRIFQSKMVSRVCVPWHIYIYTVMHAA